MLSSVRGAKEELRHELKQRGGEECAQQISEDVQEWWTKDSKVLRRTEELLLR